MTLIERLEAAEAGDFGLDSDVHVSLNLTVPRLDGLKSTTLPTVTTSLDSALALAERVLPGWEFGTYINRPDINGNRFTKI